MTIDSLAYIGVGSDKLDDWREFATRLLGMQHVARGGKEIAFRMDERAHRLVVTRETPEALAFIGWEVKHKADLDAFGAVLEDAGFPFDFSGLFFVIVWDQAYNSFLCRFLFGHCSPV